MRWTLTLHDGAQPFALGFDAPTQRHVWLTALRSPCDGIRVRMCVCAHVRAHRRLGVRALRSGGSLISSMPLLSPRAQPVAADTAYACVLCAVRECASMVTRTHSETETRATVQLSDSGMCLLRDISS
jgi:hypothetical protein